MYYTLYKMSNTDNSDRTIGQVKWFNTKTGYGFITALDGDHKDKDIFTHYSSLRVTDSQYKYLIQGEYVELVVIKSAQGNHDYQSSDVTGIKCGGLMCETRKTNMQDDKPSSNRKYKTRPSAQKSTSTDEPVTEN
jgi:cold shock CspA family protein